MNRPYEHISLPDPPPNRPFVFVNMISTLDGKILSGNRNEHVMDLGTKVDHQALRDLESHAEAVMVGAETVRATPNIWYPNDLLKLVVTKSGDIPWDRRFFTDDPARAIVVSPQNAELEIPIQGVRNWKLGANGEFDPVFAQLREAGVSVLAVEGGSELNASLIHQDLVDEYFLTVAPKIKLGRDVPTYAGGEPLPREELRQLELVSAIPVENEVFLRYRRIR